MKATAYIICLIMAISLVSATTTFDTDAKCKEAGFSNSISLWQYDGLKYNIVEEKQIMHSIKIAGNENEFGWTSEANVAGLVLFNNNAQEKALISNGKAGNILADANEDITQVLFCSKASTGGGSGNSDSTQVTEVQPHARIAYSVTNDPNQVPEFSTVTLGLAVIIGTMGLVYLRKK